MKGTIIGLIILIIIGIGLFVPISSTNIASNNSNDNNNNLENPIAITYGETTFNNNNYKTVVDDYFKHNGRINLENANQTVITAYDVNKISRDISQRTYNENQILSCAMVDLSNNNDITVDVDQSTITTVTAQMYKSALSSSGITKGHVVVTSPTTATGESALAGVMKSYETATGTPIPEELKNAANKEIYTQSEILEDTNASKEDVEKLINQTKEEVAKKNTTDQQTIITIINNIASNNNINLTQNNVNNLADSIGQTQSVQDQAASYQNQISQYVNSPKAQSIFDQIMSYIQSFINGNSININNNVNTTKN
ncbi:MAG: DUF1002 domain-containing protein [Methanosphaera stadtmanae]|nr:DUF1002 domain-containing protein [Methanosphaera stadtmanae]